MWSHRRFRHIEKTLPTDFIYVEIAVVTSSRAQPSVDLDAPRLTYGTARQSHSEPSKTRAVTKSFAASKLKRREELWLAHSRSIVKNRKSHLAAVLSLLLGGKEVYGGSVCLE